jgi:Glycosyl transferase family 2
MNDTIGIATILKDEEFLLEKTLIPLSKHFNSIACVIDDRTTDSTENILKKENILYVKRKFINFSDMVNHSISLLKTKWVLCLAADETFDDIDIANIKKIVKNSKNDCFAFKRNNWKDFERKEAWTKIYPDYQIRLFLNNNKIKFQGEVHETPDGYKQMLLTDIHIQHFSIAMEKLEPLRLQNKIELYDSLGNLGQRIKKNSSNI